MLYSNNTMIGNIYNRNGKKHDIEYNIIIQL